MRRTVASKSGARCGRSSAALDYCVRDADPSLGVRNRAAKGRSETWTEGEAVRMFKGAWRLKAITASRRSSPSHGQPNSRRATCGRLRASQLAKDASGAAFFTERGKTGVPVGGALNDRALAALHAYLEKLGIELHGEAYIFRNRVGRALLKRHLGR